MFSTLFYIVFGILFLYFILFVQFTEKLKNEYPDKYEALGSPAIGMFKGGSSGFSKFLRKREYMKLENSTLQLMGNVLLVTKIFFYIGFATLFITFFVP